VGALPEPGALVCAGCDGRCVGAMRNAEMTEVGQSAEMTIEKIHFLNKKFSF
jgi:hypothetical protein